MAPWGAAIESNDPAPRFLRSLPTEISFLPRVCQPCFLACSSRIRAISPPKRPTFLRNWICWPRRAAGSSSFQKGCPTYVLGMRLAASTPADSAGRMPSAMVVPAVSMAAPWMRPMMGSSGIPGSASAARLVRPSGFWIRSTPELMKMADIEARATRRSRRDIAQESMPGVPQGCGPRPVKPTSDHPAYGRGVVPVHLTRRELLAAGAAGGAGLAFGGLGPSALRALAAPPVCRKLTDIEHVVILIQDRESG